MRFVHTSFFVEKSKKIIKKVLTKESRGVKINKLSRKESSARKKTLKKVLKKG